MHPLLKGKIVGGLWVKILGKVDEMFFSIATELKNLEVVYWKTQVIYDLWVLKSLWLMISSPLV